MLNIKAIFDNQETLFIYLSFEYLKLVVKIKVLIQKEQRLAALLYLSYDPA